jgi:hypothetical protein
MNKLFMNYKLFLQAPTILKLFFHPWLFVLVAVTLASEEDTILHSTVYQHLCMNVTAI